MGLLDPATYFGGELKIDVERAKSAILENVGKPLGLTPEKAAEAMATAWGDTVARALTDFTDITPGTTLAAFGGAGPFISGKVAEACGAKHIVIPSLAAVFSAFGIGFSDVAHEYEARLAASSDDALKAALEQLTERARRGMFAEGFDLAECRIDKRLRIGEADADLVDGALPKTLPSGAELTFVLKATKPIAHARLRGKFGAKRKPAVASGSRRTLASGNWAELPLYRVEEQDDAVQAQGPCVLEEAFFTCRVEPGWRFEINEARDILLSRD
jgi:N-methylhydantoinase A/oxoprolinase/acetone carboxylase beta subunit